MSSHGSTTSVPSSSKTTVAPAALNVYKKIPVIRKPSDSLTYEVAEGNIKSVSAEELGDAISHATPLSQPKIKLDIPVPKILTVESYLKEIPADYEIRPAYVRYHRITDDEFKNTLEYVADAEDEAWLQKNTKFGGAVEAGKARLTLDILERMMDALEKETAFDAIITANQADTLFRNKVPEMYLLFQSKPRQGLTTAKHVLNDVYAYVATLFVAFRLWLVPPHIIFLIFGSAFAPTTDTGFKSDQSSSVHYSDASGPSRVPTIQTHISSSDLGRKK
eukprot:scaffold13497_cov107-Amphora_coffeaeformis.AAC.1